MPASQRRPPTLANDDGWPRVTKPPTLATLSSDDLRTNFSTLGKILAVVGRKPLGKVQETKMEWDVLGGRDESERRRAESQWIVAARPLCHLQYPVAYLSRLQRILPAT